MGLAKLRACQASVPLSCSTSQTRAQRARGCVGCPGHLARMQEPNLKLESL